MEDLGIFSCPSGLENFFFSEYYVDNCFLMQFFTPKVANFYTKIANTLRQPTPYVTKQKMFYFYQGFD